MKWIDDTPKRSSLASANSVDIRHSDIIEYPFENYREYHSVASINHIMYLGQKGFMATLHTRGYQRSGSVFSTFNASKSELDNIVGEWIQKIDVARKQYRDRAQE